ncbi:hypothetical protein BD779DRAFT_1549543 [Infundibulicybe gibba]|nr:hypothetical protein BD779DRAFT_1549543 [Infundibulicybe gibba]
MSIPPIFDFSTTPLAKDYAGCYIKVIDDVFTPQECADLIALAESDSKWKPAAVHHGLVSEQKYINLEYRNSERILRFDHEAAEKMFQRLLPLVPELVQVKPHDTWETMFGAPGEVTGTWRLHGLYERLSFLRYGSGGYFHAHGDGQFDLPDGRKSRVTLQVYLNDEGLSGGATRIVGRNRSIVGRTGIVYGPNEEVWVDIEPKIGRVLIFQQGRVWYSGEEVTAGMKYTMKTDFLFKQEIDDE